MADRRNDMEKRRLNDFGLSSACVPRHYAIGVCQSLALRSSLTRSIDGRTKLEPAAVRYNCPRWRINSRINGVLFRRRRAISRSEIFYVNVTGNSRDTSEMTAEGYLVLSPASVPPN